MVSATSPAMAKGKGKGAKEEAKPKKASGPSSAGGEAPPRSTVRPDRFARGSGRRRTASERAAVAEETARRLLEDASVDGPTHAGPLPGAVSTPEELDAVFSALRGGIRDAGVDGSDADVYAAADAVVDAGGAESQDAARHIARAAASRLMDQTETGPVRVRGPAAMRAQVERQAVFAEAQAVADFYEHRDVDADAVRSRRVPFSRDGAMSKEDARAAGIYENGDGPPGQDMAFLAGENLRMWATDGSDENDIVTPFGTAPLSAASPGVVEELASPIKYVLPDDSDDSDNPAATPTLRKDYSKGSFAIVDPRLSPEEQELDAERRALRAKLLDPLPIPSRPIHQQLIYLAANRQHHKIVRGGMEVTEKAMAIVGNGCGGIGFGMAKHAQADRATELAIAAAQRDMIHVSLYKGQLYHDLVGRKNNIKVILWARSPGHERPTGDAMITSIMEMMGVRHYAAKIIGPKRRNPFTVAQALFNAFDNHLPADVAAANRGLRLLRLGADRFRPRQAFPQSAGGPSFAAASSYANRTNQ